MKTVIFDFDDTLCKGQSINGYLALLRNEFGLFSTMEYYVRRLMVPYKQDDYPRYKEFLLTTFKHKPKEIFQEIARVYAKQIVEQRLYPEVLNILQISLQDPDTKVLISSGGFDIYIEPICQSLGVHNFHATRLEFSNGFFTGKIDGPENLGIQKLKNFTSLNWPSDTIEVYSDSLHDLPLFELANKVTIVTAQSDKPTWVKDAWDILYVKS